MKKGKDRLAENAAELLKVKTVVTLALVGTLCVQAARSGLMISEELFASVLTAVVTYYFTRKSEP
jgi:hypothetical protein